MFSRLPFASFAVFSPRGSSALSVRSRRLRDAVKAGRLAVFAEAASRIRADTDTFAPVFAGRPTLVPVPGSAPRVSGGLWIAERIAQALLAAELAEAIVPCLERIQAVPKSAFAARGERPTVQMHVESLAVSELALSSGELLLVDDVVTRGRTLFAAALTLKQAYPEATIGSFALLRTLGLVPDIDQIVDACRGEILYNGVDTQRLP